MAYNPHDEIAGKLVPIDLDREIPNIETKVQDYLRERKKKGVLVPVSGGLDSTAVIVLTAHALKQAGDNLELRLLYLPSDTTSQETRAIVEDVYEHVRDIYPICTFEAVSIAEELSQDPEYRASIEHQNRYLEQGGKLVGLDKPMALKVMRGEFGDKGKKATDFIGKTTILRAKYALREAEEGNLALASCGNRTEHELGLFFPGAVDDIGDFRPIEHLYKTQVRQIHQRLPFPETVIQRTPTPDIGQGAGTDEQYFGAPYPVLDCVLYHAGQEQDGIVRTLAPHYDKFAEMVEGLRGRPTEVEEVVGDVLEMRKLAKR